MRLFLRSLRRAGAFTLIELLTVMAVIAVLAALILSISGYATNKAARTRATAEIAALSLACENYKTDNGAYPEIMAPSSPGVTGTAIVSGSSDSSNIPSDNLDPRVSGNPNANSTGATQGLSSVTYTQTSLELYVALTGDISLSGTGGGPGTKNYITDFPQNSYGRAYSNASVSGTNPVEYLSDPFGNPYGYSTANAFYQSYISTPGATPLKNPPGYNPTFDLWSTGGQSANPYAPGGTSPPGSPGDPALVWLKNWQ